MVSELVEKGLLKLRKSVLILVLVEDGFGAPQKSAAAKRRPRLNPCFSGRWFRRAFFANGLKPVLYIPEPQTFSPFGPFFRTLNLHYSYPLFQITVH